MTNEEYTFAALLKEMYDSAPRGKKMLAIHLFGIIHGASIQASGARGSEIAKLAFPDRKLEPEVNYGINLSRYVMLKPGAQEEFTQETLL